MEKTDEKLALLIEKLQDVGFAQAPEVIDAAIRAIVFNGTLQLGFGVLFLVLSCLMVALLIYGVHKDIEGLQIAGKIWTILFLPIMIALWAVENPWLKVSDPEAWLYFKMLSKILLN